jgi:hypothetical protein
VRAEQVVQVGVQSGRLTSTTGRTSTAPRRAAGIFAAQRSASSRLAHSSRY